MHKNAIYATRHLLPLSTFFNQLKKMPPQRTPLAPKSFNIIPYKHISPDLRARICGKAEAGVRPSQLAKDYGLEYSTVWRTIQKDLQRYESADLPKAPRKKSYTIADERNLLRHVRLNPKDTYKQIITACGLGCKTTTVKKILKQHGIANWRAKRRPFLTEANAAKRLTWCLERRHWTAED